MTTYNELDFIRNNYASTYGELTENGLHKLMQNINIKNKVFYDLGSGKGNVVLYAARNYPSLKKCKGIELHNVRHEEALQKLKEEQETIQKKVSFTQGDILKEHIGDGDIFYISNLCFPETVNEEIYKKLNKEMKPNSCVFCSKPLCKKRKSFVNRTVKQTWWENSDVYKYKKGKKGLISCKSENEKNIKKIKRITRKKR